MGTPGGTPAVPGTGSAATKWSATMDELRIVLKPAAVAILPEKVGGLRADAAVVGGLRADRFPNWEIRDKLSGVEDYQEKDIEGILGVRTCGRSSSLALMV